MTRMLIIDDDAVFRDVLQEALAARGFDVRHAGSGEEAMEAAGSFVPEWVVLDLKIGHESGLRLIPRLLTRNSSTRIVVLTGYAAVETAVEAIKLGALHYLSKPAEASQIIAAFERESGDPLMPIESPAQSAAEMEWCHIRAALARHQGNISATARALKMHRRTLQRKLDKMPSPVSGQ